MKRVSICLSAVLLSACVTAIPPSKGISSGNLAYERGDYEQAKKDFSVALQVAMQQNWKPHIATAKYGLGRSLGQLCEFNEAERNLKEAAELEEKLSGGKSIYLSQDYFELARLYYDYGRYSMAVSYFQLAIPIADGFGAEASDPIGYADVLADFAVALARSGATGAADAIQTRIYSLRQNNPGKRAGFHIVRFNPACAPNNSVR